MSNYSDFWIGDNSIDWDFSEESDQVDVSNAKSEKTSNLIRLNAARRAISNYVSILTNKNLPVLFNNNNTSLTDGKVVYIGSDVHQKNNFDVAVGLALHEASHIVYTDFDLFKTIWQNVPREIYDITEKLGISKEVVARTCHQILNVVEDRYIDYCVYNNAPGYRGYYQSLYKKYFHSNSIDDGLKSELYRTPSIESYLYRLINITNQHTDLNALPGLYDIAKILNLQNIKRLNTPNDRYKVSVEITKILFKNIIDSVKNDTAEPNSDKNEKGSKNESGDGDSSDNSSKNLDDLFGGEESTVSTINDNGDMYTADIGKDNKISETKMKKIRNSFEKQKKFLDGNLNKKKVTTKDSKILDVLEQSKIELIDVGSDFIADSGAVGATECILVKNMTRELMMSDQFPLTPYYELRDYGQEDFVMPKYAEHFQNSINEGISLGVKIGKRLQFRNEVNVDKFSRRETGRIDKRLLNELGFDEENVFYTNNVHKYKKMHFHISVDASASMSEGGSGTYNEQCKWSKTIKLVTAFAKAASILENIRVTISFRTTFDKMPYVVIAYDSNVDKFSKIKNLFAYLNPNGNTPEGLCYEAILKSLPKADNETECYFINFSDGEPCFHFDIKTNNMFTINYSGEKAAHHTKKQVNKIRKNGYNIISYFITGVYNSERSSSLFRTMYGNDSNFINVNSLNQIVKTLNDKLLNSVE